MEGCFMFEWGEASFLSGGEPQGDIGFSGLGGSFEKIVRWGACPSHAPLPHYGKPCSPH